ncbi:sulfotransferase [Hahella ganghwensis]|uniref:sulfotransferase n=1 Tax=Hahella ganghwensis TaxID=286420 RepID=UPI00037DFEA8|nr:sulfotransferase [Hahella ganghwensis]
MSFKTQVKDLSVKIFQKFLSQPPVQVMLDDKIADSNQLLPSIHNQAQPYFTVNSTGQTVSERDDIVFISSRFRSGSTLLWNIFRQTESCTSYYEPFNERRWFNSAVRGERVDNTHRGVNDYWREYDGMDDIDSLYNEDWIRSRLLMMEDVWDPQMNRFIDQLVTRAPLRPVLQFNRIDFRLPWLRKHYPNARFLHLYRHPRDQWCSFLTDEQVMNSRVVEQTYQDAFYLDVWCNDLAKYFPVLDKRHTPHPYQRFYYLWKLSFLFGQKYSDHSISFESLNENPEQELEKMFDVIGLQDAPMEKLCGIFQAPPKERWRKYADEQWFSEHEMECEHNLNQMLGKSS